MKSISSQHRMNNSRVRSLSANCSMSKLTRTPFSLRLQEQRAKRFDQAVDRTRGVDGIGLGVERTDLDRDVGPRNRAEMVAFEFLVLRPAVDRVGEILDQIHVLRAVVRGFGVRDAGFAQQIDAEGEAFLPEFLQHRKRVGGIGTRDELLGHAGDLLGHRLGEHRLGDAAGLDRQIHAGRGRDSGL